MRRQHQNFVEERTPIAPLSVPGRGDMFIPMKKATFFRTFRCSRFLTSPSSAGSIRLRTSRLESGRHTPTFGCSRSAGNSPACRRQTLSPVSEVRIHSGHDMVLYSADTGVPIIFGRGDAAKKMVKLDAFWKKFIAEQGSQDIRYIDIRFDDQVIVSSMKPADSHNIKKSS